MNKYFLADAFKELWPEPEECYESTYGYDLSTHPTAMCARALSAYNRGDMDEFLKGADWLVESQNPQTGGWEIPFSWKVPGYEGRMPWISCMTQGMGLSVLARTDKRDNEGNHICAWSLRPFLFPFEDGGLYRGVDKGMTCWYDGIPSPKGYQILNEFMFALIGLRECVDLLHDTGHSLGLLNDGLATLNKHLKDFDLNLPWFKWSRYDNGYYWYSGPKYHEIMIKQLLWLGEKTGSEKCLQHGAKWDEWRAKYGKDCRAKYIMLRVWKIYNMVLRRVR